MKKAATASGVKDPSKVNITDVANNMKELQPEIEKAMKEVEVLNPERRALLKNQDDVKIAKVQEDIKAGNVGKKTGQKQIKEIKKAAKAREKEYVKTLDEAKLEYEEADMERAQKVAKETGKTVEQVYREQAEARGITTEEMVLNHAKEAQKIIDSRQMTEPLSETFKKIEQEQQTAKARRKQIGEFQDASIERLRRS